MIQSKTDIVSTSIMKAHRASKRDGRLRFVYAGGYGMKISLKDWIFQARMVTNGVTIWFYDRMVKLTPENGKDITSDYC